MVVFGTRPEAIKMCPVINELKRAKEILPVLVVTGQHRQMLDQVLDVFEIIPDYDLAIMEKGQTLFDITDKILLKIEKILINESPDIVLVHGDTTTAFVTSLACFYLKIPIGHVEAGLRTYNIYSPYPEEFNRQAISIISKYNFAPTNQAKNNLIKEGRERSSIYVTGNTAIDALKTTIKDNFEHPELQWALSPVQGYNKSKMILITAHRRENIGKPMENMFRAIRRVLEENKEIKALYPVHLNPTVIEIANKIFKGIDRIHLIEPLDVISFHNFMNQAYLIITDSGGIQEEAPALGKPVLVMRDTTERPEGVEAGTLKLVGTEEQKIYEAFSELIYNYEVYEKMSKASNPYGDGNASKRIVDVILNN